MELAQLLGRYARLRQDLHAAYVAPLWHSGRIDRLADELVETEREIARCQPVDEQTCEVLPAFAFTR